MKRTQPDPSQSQRRSPARPGASATLSQAEMDQLTSGVDFDDFDLSDSSSSPSRPSPRPSASKISPARTRSPTPLSSTKPRLVDDEPLLPAPPPDNPAALERMAAAVDLSSSRYDQEIIELSDDSIELSPIRFPTSRTQKENLPPRPKAQVEVTKRLFTVPPPATPSSSSSKPQPPANKPGWFAQPSSSLPASTARKTGPVVATKEAYTKAVERTRKINLRDKAAQHRDKEARLAQLHAPFDYESYSPVPRVVYATDERVIARELAAMTGPLGFDLECVSSLISERSGSSC